LPECARARRVFLLAETQEIDRDRLPDVRSPTIIWVVVDGDDAFVRSVNGATARWYREAVASPEVTIHAPDLALHVRAVPAVDADSVHRTSEALARKYAGRAGIKPMLRPEVLDTTLRLTPG
jgi:hypothetical protein